MMISQNGLLFIQDWEKFRPKAYKDLAGIWTIGFGTTRYFDGAPVKKDDTITLEQATTYQLFECDGIALKITSWIKVPLLPNQFDALVSFCYNVGVNGFKTSTLLKELNARREIKENYFTRWNKAHIDGKLVVVNGLTNRRKAEYRLFSNGDFG